MIYKVIVLWVCFFLIFKNNVECDNIRLELYKYFVLWIFLFVLGIFGIMFIWVKMFVGFNVLNFVVICCCDKKVLCGNNN